MEAWVIIATIEQQQKTLQDRKLQEAIKKPKMDKTNLKIVDRRRRSDKKESYQLWREVWAMTFTWYSKKNFARLNRVGIKESQCINTFKWLYGLKMEKKHNWLQKMIKKL